VRRPLNFELPGNGEGTPGDVGSYDSAEEPIRSRHGSDGDIVEEARAEFGN
jgi:hypothetical protein